MEALGVSGGTKLSFFLFFFLFFFKGRDLGSSAWLALTRQVSTGWVTGFATDYQMMIYSNIQPWKENYLASTAQSATTHVVDMLYKYILVYNGDNHHMTTVK